MGLNGARLPTGDEKVYLGDGVYAQWEDTFITLTTEYGQGPTNRVVLEPNVFQALVTFVERVGKRRSHDH